MDNEKKVEVPGIKIRNHLDIWEREIPITNEEEINYFAVSAIFNNLLEWIMDESQRVREAA